MNGPEHYKEAERRLQTTAAQQIVPTLIALTHAVLALCAAVVENDHEVGFAPEELDRWVKAGAVTEVDGGDPA